VAVVLLYHRVAELAHDPWGLAVAPARFAEQLEALVTRFSPLSLRGLVTRMEADDLPPDSVALTFDDGYRDNLDAAEPLLARHGVPATIFVVSWYAGSGREFWWDELEALSEPERLRDLHAELQVLPHDERLARVAAMRADAGRRPSPPVQTLREEELGRLATSEVVEIGSHTMTHPALPVLQREDMLDEMRASRERLEQLTGAPVLGLSYPYGSWDAETAACAEEVGYEYACTSAREAVGRGTRRFAIPRFPVKDWSGDELARRISGWLAG
jgi:peptidoglycan/xylan/chitin deacetylase (PgdA/CDA1 family)